MTVDDLVLRIYGPNANILESIGYETEFERFWSYQFKIVNRKIRNLFENYTLLRNDLYYFSFKLIEADNDYIHIVVHLKNFYVIKLTFKIQNRLFSNCVP
jgi:hypothetical protein